jgi:hypothetical protein
VNDITQAKQQIKAPKTAIDGALYQNLTKFCPDLPKLKEGDFRVLKSPRSQEIVIGCVKPATPQYPNGIYEIDHPKNEGKASLTVEVSHRDKSASAMILKEQGKSAETSDNYFYKLLKDMERGGYKADKTAAFERA